MAGALVDGAIKGFTLMERFKDNEFRRQRLADLDQRDEDRYQDNQQRLSDMNNERKAQREEDLAWRDKQANLQEERRKDDVAWREQQATNAEAQREWQRNYQTQQQQWKQDQQAIPVAWQAFRATGHVPEEMHEVFSRNPGMDPRTYLNPEYRQSVKALGGKIEQVIKTGKMAEVNSPETVQLFGEVFKHKLQSSVGQYDDVVKSKIAKVDFAGFVPIESRKGDVGLALKVTYENGHSEIKPMTKGRTSQNDDPVMTYTPKELISTINQRVMMADMMERPEYYDKIGAQVNANYGRSNKDEKGDYKAQVVKLMDAKTKAISKLDDNPLITKEDRQQAIDNINSQFNQQKAELDKLYGLSKKDQKPGDGMDLSTLSDDDLIAELNAALGAQ